MTLPLVESRNGNRDGKKNHLLLPAKGSMVAVGHPFERKQVGSSAGAKKTLESNFLAKPMHEPGGEGSRRNCS